MDLPKHQGISPQSTGRGDREAAPSTPTTEGHAEGRAEGGGLQATGQGGHNAAASALQRLLKPLCSSWYAHV